MLTELMAMGLSTSRGPGWFRPSRFSLYSSEVEVDLDIKQSYTVESRDESARVCV